MNLYGNWQTTYTDPSGNYENSVAVLQGNSGTYYLPDGNVGYLSNIQEGFPPFNPGAPESSNGIFGYWQAEGSSGWFYWAMIGSNPFQPDRFEGSWGFGNFGSPRVGSWNGSRSNEPVGL